VSANAGPREVAAPASAAATATPIFVRAERVGRGVAPGKDRAARIRLRELITASPNQLTFSSRPAALAGGRLPAIIL
jgi:hypothetical protein